MARTKKLPPEIKLLKAYVKSEEGNIAEYSCDFLKSYKRLRKEVTDEYGCFRKSNEVEFDKIVAELDEQIDDYNDLF